jgi:NADH-quinone oxidoreductase subunit N
MAPYRLDLFLLLPDLFLLGAPLVLLGLALATAQPSNASLLGWGAQLSLGLALLLQLNRVAGTGIGGPGQDPLATFFRWLLLGGGFLLLLAFQGLFRRDSAFPYEFPLLLLLALSAYTLLAGCSTFLVLYLALELGSFCLYLLAALRRSSLFSTEAGLKYFLLGGLSSAFLLLGLTLLYGRGGTLVLMDWALLLAHWPVTYPLPLFPLALLFFGLAFKLALVPFHLWAPDVYDGAPLPSTAFFAALAKLGVLALAVRLLYAVFAPLVPSLLPLLLALGTVSVVLGTLGALAQRRLKRFLAYSAIVHGGWVVLALGAGGPLGLFAAAGYSLVYLVISLNLFGLLLPLRRRPGDRRPRTLEDLGSLFRTNPALAAVLAANLLSLAGIPPLAGFGAKLLVLLALVAADQSLLALLLVLLAVVSTVYYIRLLRMLYFDRPLRWQLLRPLSPANLLLLVPSTLANLLLLPLAIFWLPLPLLLS